MSKIPIKLIAGGKFLKNIHDFMQTNASKYNIKGLCDLHKITYKKFPNQNAKNTDMTVFFGFL